ncbi:MAG: hypothetical protein V4543_13335 [Bacteroidota bacterium]
MTNKICGCLLMLLLCFTGLNAQSVMQPLNPDFYYLLDRFEVKSGRMATGFHSSVKPFERKGVAELADSLWKHPNDSAAALSAIDRDDISWIQHDNSEWTQNDSVNHSRRNLGYFYRRPADAIHYSDSNFDLHASPVFLFQYGKTNDINTPSHQGNPIVNTRGAEVRGMIAKKVGFYSYFSDNQVLMPAYTDTYNKGMMPGEGFWKRYKLGGYDYLSARGYFTFSAAKFIHFRAGYDKNTVGNGYRSLILSDFSNAYAFLEINTRVWKLNYRNLFARLNYDVPYDYQGVQAGNLLPVKFMAMHHLSMNIGSRLNIGLFESIIFARNSVSQKSGNSFDFSYVNPIIFYRYAESNNGSPDNVNVGTDFKLNLFRHISLYGQVVLDEFLLKEIKAGNGWWGNKQAAQIGIKYYDAAGIKNLDLQAEYNYVRPFTYSHINNSTSYTNYNMPLAHPYGANFREVVGILRYRPIKRLYITAKGIYCKQGMSVTGSLVGEDPTVSYAGRSAEYGFTTGGGVPRKILYADLTASYRIRHNLFVDLKQVIRNQTTDGAEMNTTFSSLSLRLNIAQKVQEY